MKSPAPPRVIVRATCDHHAGKRQINGSREVAIHKGDTREITYPGEQGLFYTYTTWGTLIMGRVRSGWEIVGVLEPVALSPAEVFREDPEQDCSRDEEDDFWPL